MFSTIGMMKSLHASITPPPKTIASVSTVPDVDAGVAEHLGRAGHDLGHQFVLDLEGLADHAASDDGEVAAGQVAQDAGAPGGDGLAQVALDGGAAGQGLEAAAVAAAALGAGQVHDDVADLAGRLAVAAPQLAALDEAAADARAHANVERALGLAGGAEPGFAQWPKLPSLPRRWGP